jgi:hypothetical protein
VKVVAVTKAIAFSTLGNAHGKKIITEDLFLDISHIATIYSINKQKLFTKVIKYVKLLAWFGIWERVIISNRIFAHLATPQFPRSRSPDLPTPLPL